MTEIACGAALRAALIGESLVGEPRLGRLVDDAVQQAADQEA